MVIVPGQVVRVGVGEVERDRCRVREVGRVDHRPDFSLAEAEGRDVNQIVDSPKLLKVRPLMVSFPSPAM